MIPKGFQVSQKKGQTEIEKGLVVRNANDENEFVWIPVDTIGQYRRELYNAAYGGISNYYETMPTVEKSSVELYKGFYIGRFEAGTSKQRTSEDKNTTMPGDGIIAKSGKPQFKKALYPYSVVTYQQANYIASKLYSSSSDSVISRLPSSYAWDTTLKFIEKNYSYYPMSNNEGNYREKEFKFMEVDGAIQKKYADEGMIVPTGETTPVNNISDMGGNVWEWTTENYKNGSINNMTRRGGDYSDYFPAAYRSNSNSSTTAGDFLGFRVTLFIK